MTIRRLSIIILALLLLAGCTPPAPAATAVQAAATAAVAATPTLAPTHEATKSAPTDTPAAPTGTPVATAVSATAVPAAGPLGAQSIKELAGWCLPVDAAVTYAKDPLTPPKNAKIGHIGQNLLVLRNLPSNGCTFVYTFTQAAPAGLKLEVSALKQPKAFLTADLQPVANRADVLSVFVRHSLVIDPPEGGQSLTFTVKDPLGQTLRQDQVNLYRWLPGTPAPREADTKENCGCTLIIP